MGFWTALMYIETSTTPPSMVQVCRSFPFKIPTFPMSGPACNSKFVLNDPGTISPHVKHSVLAGWTADPSAGRTPGSDGMKKAAEHRAISCRMLHV